MISAHGFIIARNEVPITEVREVTPPALRRDQHERTTVSDPDDEYRMSIRKCGELIFTVGLVPAHQELITAWANESIDVYLLTFPDGDTWEFSGQVESIVTSAYVDSGLTAVITIRPTGNVVTNGVLLHEPGGKLLLETGGFIVL